LTFPTEGGTMATKEKNLQPPAVPGPDATEAEMREFEQAKRDY
jgi:hypothetical protein